MGYIETRHCDCALDANVLEQTAVMVSYQTNRLCPMKGAQSVCELAHFMGEVGYVLVDDEALDEEAPASHEVWREQEECWATRAQAGSDGERWLDISPASGNAGRQRNRADAGAQDGGCQDRASWCEKSKLDGSGDYCARAYQPGAPVGPDSGASGQYPHGHELQSASNDCIVEEPDESDEDVAVLVFRYVDGPTYGKCKPSACVASHTAIVLVSATSLSFVFQDFTAPARGADIGQWEFRATIVSQRVEQACRRLAIIEDAS